jgi:1,4-dihydroxy-2-naphthoate octaprenyltransferase
MEEIRNFKECIVSFMGHDRYPYSYSTSFTVEDQVIYVGKTSQTPKEGRVTLTFNHITPLPSGGYTDRRYVTVKGVSSDAGERIRVIPEKVYGWDEKKTPFPEYCEVSVPQSRRYVEELVKTYGPKAGPRMSIPSLLFRSTRFPFLVATATPVLIANMLALYVGRFDPILFLLTLVGASLIHLGLNMSNDYFDTMLGADNINRTPTPFSGGSRILQYGLLKPSTVAGLFTLFYLAGGLIGVYLSIVRGLIPILSIMAAGVLISILYTAPPVKLAYRGLGEIAVGVGFGPVIVLGSYYVQSQELHLSALLASIPIGILIALILYINEIPDAPYDLAAGKRTLATRLSREGVINLYKVLLTTSYLFIVIPIILGLAPPTAALPLVTIPMAVKAVRLVRENYGNPYMMIPAMGANIKLATWTGLLHAVGFAIAALIRVMGV